MRKKANLARPLRIVQYEPSGLGGFCHYTYQLSEALTRQGCDVTVVTTSGYELNHLPRRFRTMFLFQRSRAKRLFLTLFARRGRSAQTVNVQTTETVDRDTNSSLRALRVRFLQLRLVCSFLRRRPDVVHFQSTRRGTDLFLIRLLKRLRFHVVCTAHDLLPHDSTAVSEWKAHAEIYRIVDRVIVHAENNRNEMMEVFGVPAERIVVIPHGSYDLLFPNGRLSKEASRGATGIPRDGKVVLFFGLIKRYKGLEYLLQAFQYVAQRVPGAFLAVVGDIFRADSDGYAFYSRLLEEASSQDNVLCVPKYVSVDEVAPYLSAADVIVLPYTKTYQSGVLLSAYAAGRPVVVTATGGLPEIVRDGKTGLVVPPRDSRSLADAIGRLLERPELAEEMGRNAAMLGDTIYSWETIARSTVELYRAVTRRGSATEDEYPSEPRPSGLSSSKISSGTGSPRGLFGP